MRRNLASLNRIGSWAATVLLLAGGAGCGGASGRQVTLTVFAAASLADTFGEIGRAFEAAHASDEVAVTFNFAGSQVLRAQLEHGAVADIFASAGAEEVDALQSQGRVAAGGVRTFATNRLVILLPSGNPAGIHSPADLSRPGLKLVLAAEQVPVGRYTQRVLQHMDATFAGGFLDGVLANVVSREPDVRQIVAKLRLDEADAGIAYASDAVAAPELETVAIPDALNVTARYPIAVLADAPQPDWAAAFVDFVTSDEGQAILSRWGFGPANT